LKDAFDLFINNRPFGLQIRTNPAFKELKKDQALIFKQTGCLQAIFNKNNIHANLKELDRKSI